MKQKGLPRWPNETFDFGPSATPAGVLRRARGILVLFNPLLKAIGHERLDKPFAAVEGAVKGFLFDSQSCGQCTLGETQCPKTLRNGPCGGVRQNGGCEIKPEMTCVWVWEGSQKIGTPEDTITIIQPPVDNRLKGRSAWLRALRLRTGESA